MEKATTSSPFWRKKSTILDELDLWMTPKEMERKLLFSSGFFNNLEE